MRKDQIPDRIIVVGPWTEPYCVQGYFLFEDSGGMLKITEDENVRDRVKNSAYEQVRNDESILSKSKSVWLQQLLPFSPRTFRRIQKKVAFFKNRVDQFNQYYDQYWDTYEDAVVNPEKTAVRLYLSYYFHKVEHFSSAIYRRCVYPLISIYFHDIRTVFVYAPKLLDLEDLVRRTEAEIAKAPTSWALSEADKPKEITRLRERLSLENSQIADVRKALTESNRTLLTVGVAFLGLLLSMLSFIAVYRIKEGEIDRLKEQVQGLQRENIKLLTAEPTKNMEIKK